MPNGTIVQTSSSRIHLHDNADPIHMGNWLPQMPLTDRQTDRPFGIFFKYQPTDRQAGSSMDSRACPPAAVFEFRLWLCYTEPQQREHSGMIHFSCWRDSGGFLTKFVCWVYRLFTPFSQAVARKIYSGPRFSAWEVAALLSWPTEQRAKIKNHECEITKSHKQIQ